MKTKRWKFTSWVILVSFFAQYGSALAMPGLREKVRAEIASEFEKQYEKETPGIGPSLPDKILDLASSGVKEHAVEMLTDFKMGVLNGARLAWEGNNTIVVVGGKNGWRLFKEYGKAAGIHYVDTVWMLPKKAVKIGQDFAKAGKNIGDIASRRAAHTADAWKETAADIKADYEEWKDGARLINDLAGAGYESSYDAMIRGFKTGADDAARWTKGVYDWTKDATADAARDLTTGTVNNAERTWRWTRDSAEFWAGQTADAARSVNAWSRAAWDWTYDATSKTWSATTRAGATVFEKTTGAAGDAGQWVKKHTLTPARQSRDGIVDVSKWNWKKGWTEGVAGGIETASTAWENDDKLMATLWTMAGIGKGIFHILLLEPVAVPVLATYGVAGTVTLSALGYPSVGAMYAAGTLASGATYAGGTVATGAVAVGGATATVVAGGAGVLRTGATAAIGVAGTAGAAVVGGGITVGAAGVNLVRTVGTPVVGGLGMAGAALGGGAEIAGSALWGTAKMTGITALAGTGYTVLTGYEAVKMTWAATRALGITVFDNAVMTPVGVVTNLAQAVATGAWTLAEDPVLGTLDVLAAGGIAIGTIVTSTGAFTYELLKGMLTGLAHGVAVVGFSGLWVVGIVAKGVEWVVSAVNVPQHREWAAFRRDEIAASFVAIKEEAGPALAGRFGDIILVRVHWWGEEKGRVRFFITKNQKTGERWYFKRELNKETCQVMYKVTNQDPFVRAFANNPWKGEFGSSFFHRGCENEKPKLTKSL